MQWAQHQLYVLNVWRYEIVLNAEEGRSQNQQRARIGAELTWNDLNHDPSRPTGYRALMGWGRDKELCSMIKQFILHTMFLYMDGYFTILRSSSWGWFLFPPGGQVHWEQHYCSQTEELLPAQALSKHSEHPESGLLRHVLCNYIEVQIHIVRLKSLHISSVLY